MLSNDVKHLFGSRELRYEAQSRGLIFLGQVAKVIRERGVVYGPPEAHWTRTAELYTALLGPKLKPGETITAREVAELYILDKLSRDVETPKADNILDIAGYAAGIATLGGEG